MWKVEYNRKNGRYYLVNGNTSERRIVPALIETKRYQQYYDKAHVACEYLNGHTVYHIRIVSGKKVMYRMHK